MYSPPAYVWAASLVGVIGFPAATCVMLYLGARSAGSNRRRAALLSVIAAITVGGWFVASAVIAAGGHYHTVLGKQLPWLPIAAGAATISLAAMSRIPSVRVHSPAETH